MTAKIIDGKAIALQVRNETRLRTTEFVDQFGYRPGLATILVGNDPASQVYVANKRKSAGQVGIADFHRHIDGDADTDTVADRIAELADDPRISGILLQLPLPPHFDTAALIESVPAAKDVDGLTVTSQGRLARGLTGLRPCTPSGVIALLEASGVRLSGAEAVVVGRSELVGKPLAQLLLQENATVTVAHSRTSDLARVTARGDILVAAAGVPDLITAAHVKPGATVIDVGIHRTAAGLSGDVHFATVREVAGLITPVPGGVGPMTIAMLLRNTVIAAASQAGESRQATVLGSGPGG